MSFDQDMARVLIDDPELNETLWLIKNGIPFDVAWSLDQTERYVWSIIFGIFEGGNFNRETMQFEKPGR
jgi:hypothetical protein